MNGNGLRAVTCLLQTRFDFNGNTYSYCTVQDFLRCEYNLDLKTFGKTKILNIGCAFDIETYKVGDFTTMYVWQFAFGDVTIIGRTWEDFKKLIAKISEYYETGKDRKLICWIHNASYEWSFMKKLFEWNKVFAIEKRKVVTFEIDGIQFRDSLILTNRKLEYVATDYQTGLKKLTEVYNYDLPMSSVTPLKLCQLAYCINDVQILARFFETYIKPEFLIKGHKIPLTSTGIVRDEMKRKFKQLPADDRNKWKKKVFRGFPTEKEYTLLMRWVFRGGYVHANSVYSGEKIKTHTGSQDFKSSYPAVMLHENYPFRFIKKDKKFFYHIKDNRKWMNENAFYGTFTFYRLRTKTSHTLESKNKVLTGKNIKTDNGRVCSADVLTVAMTEQDWILYNAFYDWEICVCNGLRIASKEPLPNWFKDMILEYYYKKSTVPKDDIHYMLSKMQLNSLYGMSVTGIYDTSLEWDIYTGDFIEKKKETSYEELIENILLPPFIGIWVTAYARKNIGLTIAKLGTYSAYYGDTDSIKYRNILTNQYIFDCYNDRMERINNRMYVGEYPRHIYKDLGKFDYEGKSYFFLANGAKRYIHTDVCFNKKKGKYELKDIVTIAGLPKGKLQEKATREKISVYDLFVDDMKLSEIESGKLTSKYIDFDFDVTYTDYKGNVVTQSEKSCVTLCPAEFTMSITEEYLKYREMEKQRNKYIIGERKM